MSEIGALLSFSVVTEIENIIESKYVTSEKYISACKKNNWKFINPSSNGQRANLYKFILISRSLDPIKVFENIKNRTSSVYDYSLGNDFDEIVKRHICLPVWYELENENVNNVIFDLSK